MPSCTSKPPSVLSEPCFSIFFGISASSDGSSLPWPRPVCALERPLLHLQSLFSFVWVPTLDDVFARLLRLSSTQTLSIDGPSNSSVLAS